MGSHTAVVLSKSTMSVNTEQFIGKEGQPFEVSYNRRDLITYAIGIGCTELPFVYELHKDFVPFPSYPIVLGFKGDEQDIVPFPSPAMMNTPFAPLPGVVTALDGERLIEVIKPLPAEGATLIQHDKLIGIFKRGSGAAAQVESTI